MKRPLLHSFILFLFVAALSFTSVNYLISHSSSVVLMEEGIDPEKAPANKKTSFDAEEDFLTECLTDEFRFLLLKEDGHKLFFLSHTGEFFDVHLEVETPPPDKA